MSDIDDFFELDDGQQNQSKKKESEQPKKEQADSSENDLFGNLDDLIDSSNQNEQSADQSLEALEQASISHNQIQSDDKKNETFEELNLQESNEVEAIPKTPNQAGTQGSGNIDDMFADFLNVDEEKSEAGMKGFDLEPSDKLPKTEQIKEDHLEELFDEQPVQNVTKPLGARSVKTQEIEQEHQDIEAAVQVKKKIQIPLKKISIGLGALLGVAAIVVLSMAKFSSSGFLGFKIGQSNKDEYRAPSASVLAQLKEKYNQGLQLLNRDRLDDYKKAIDVFDAIVKTDERNMLGLSGLAEAMVLSKGHNLEQEMISKIDKNIKVLDTYYPEKIETVRSKARFAMGTGKLSDATTLSSKALKINGKDPLLLILQGEIAYEQGRLEEAKNYFNQAKEINPNLLRGQYYAGLTLIKSNEPEQAKEIFTILSNTPHEHVMAQVELYRLNSLDEAQIDLVILNLSDFLKQKGPLMGSFDRGQSWHFLSDLQLKKTDVLGAIESLRQATLSDPLSATHCYALGKIFREQKKYEEAVSQFQKATALNSKEPMYFLSLGQALRDTEKYNQSVGEFQKALELSKNDPNIHYELGLSQRANGLFDEAQRSFQKALEMDPGMTISMVELGELYFQRDNISEAQSQFATVLEVNPKSVRALMGLGSVYLTKRKNSQALELFKKAEYEEPTNISVLLHLSKVYIDMSMQSQAQEFLTRASNIDEGNVDVQLTLGELYMQKQDYNKAGEIYRRLIQLNSKNFRARVGLARKLIEQKTFQEAITELEEASKYNPKYFETKLYSAVAWRGAGDLERSLENVRQAIRIRPESPHAYHELEITHIYRNDIVGAEEAMQKAISIDPTFSQPLAVLGDYYKSQNLYLQAQDYYLKAIEISPKNQDYLLNLAELYKSDGRSKQAKLYYEKTIKADPKNANAYLGLGLLADENKDPKSASLYYQKARSLDPLNPKPHYYLGFIYRQMNNSKAAVASFVKYLELNPDSKEKEDIQEQIAKIRKGQ